MHFYSAFSNDTFDLIRSFRKRSVTFFRRQKPTPGSNKNKSYWFYGLPSSRYALRRFTTVVTKFHDDNTMIVLSVLLPKTSQLAFRRGVPVRSRMYGKMYLFIFFYTVTNLHVLFFFLYRLWGGTLGKWGSRFTTDGHTSEHTSIPGVPLLWCYFWTV